MIILFTLIVELLNCCFNICDFQDKDKDREKEKKSKVKDPLSDTELDEAAIRERLLEKVAQRK